MLQTHTRGRTLVAAAVVIGVLCGVGASIPTSLVILFLARRRERQEEEKRATYPPVVVVQSPALAGQSPASDGSRYVPPYLPQLTAEPIPRQFRIVGQEDTIDAEWELL